MNKSQVITTITNIIACFFMLVVANIARDNLVQFISSVIVGTILSIILDKIINRYYLSRGILNDRKR